VTAVIPTHDRPDDALTRVLERISEEPIDEVVIVDNGSVQDVGRIVEREGATLLRCRVNTGIGARNRGAEVARGDLLLMLDDDSYPLPGTVAKMRAAFERSPRLGILGGKVVDVDPEGDLPLRTGEEVGSFDWFSRYGFTKGDDARGSDAIGGIPSFFAAEGASMIRRAAHQQVGGFFEPYYQDLAELDLATRLLGAGWEVRYLASASFHHLRSIGSRIDTRTHLRLRRRVRNQIWYFWRHFPPVRAASRVAGYLAFDLVDCTYRGAPSAWTGGLSDAWRQRDLVRGTRSPVAHDIVPRIELHRGRAHAALLWHALASRLRRT